MGAGIAHVTLDKANLSTVLKDTNDKNLNRGVAQIQNGLLTAVKKKKITQ